MPATKTNLPLKTAWSAFLKTSTFVTKQITWSALKSLALYHDYEWLAPKSPRYNTIVQKLSDRLVAVDLLDRAESLLTGQLRNVPMTPVDRAKIGTRLALIYLFNHKDGEALLMLDDTENGAIPQTLALQRKIIRAKALTNLNREEEALALLKDDYSKKPFC